MKLNYGKEINEKELNRILRYSTHPKKHFFRYLNHYLCKITKESSTMFVERIYDDEGHIVDFNIKRSETDLKSAYNEWAYKEETEYTTATGKTVSQEKMRKAISDWLISPKMTRFDRIVFEPHSPKDDRKNDKNLNL